MRRRRRRRRFKISRIQSVKLSSSSYYGNSSSSSQNMNQIISLDWPISSIHPSIHGRGIFELPPIKLLVLSHNDERRVGAEEEELELWSDQKLNIIYRGPG